MRAPPPPPASSVTNVSKTQNKAAGCEIVPLQLCLKLNQSTGCAERESSPRSSRCPKQRLLLPLVENADYDSQLVLPSFLLPFIDCCTAVVDNTMMRCPLALSLGPNVMTLALLCVLFDQAGVAPSN